MAPYAAFVMRTGRPSDAERRKREWGLVEEVEQDLLGEGNSEDFIELLKSAFTNQGGGAGLVANEKARHAARVSELTKLYLQEADSHDRLHTFFGTRRRMRLQPTRWYAASRRARETRIEWGAAPSCRLKEKCASPVAAVRKHAEFVRWLGRTIEEAKAIQIEEIDEDLSSKAAIVAFMRREPPLSYEAIAAFILVRAEGREPPLDEGLLRRTARNLRQLQVDEKKKSKKR